MAELQVYGAASSQDSQGTPAAGVNTSFREKLMNKFKSTDFVRVINTDDEPFSWQWMPSTKEHVTINADFTDDVYREMPEIYTLKPGESQVLIGENAFLMIEGLFKVLSAKRAIGRRPNLEPGGARQFNFSDDAQQETAIKDIYLGKERPTFDTPAPVATVDPIDDELNKELGQGDDSVTTQTTAPIRQHPTPKAA